MKCLAEKYKAKAQTDRLEGNSRNLSSREFKNNNPTLGAYGDIMIRPDGGKRGGC